MRKIISIKKINVLFLTIVLIAGTITVFFPSSSSFITEVRALSDFGLMIEDYNSKHVSYKKDDIKCNNINVNVNGFNGAILPTGLSGLATDDEAQAADEGEVGASYSGGGGAGDGKSSGSDSDSRFVCINNNNNVRVGDDDDDDQPIPTNLDLAVVNFVDNDVSILLGNGDGTFTEEPTESPITVGNNPFAVVVGLFDDDTIPDLAVSNRQDGTVSILLGDGDGTFTEEPTESPVTVGTGPFSVAVGDFNGDTNLDLAIVNGGDGNVSILLGNGDGTFDPATPATVDVGNNPIGLAVGEFDGL